MDEAIAQVVREDEFWVASWRSSLNKAPREEHVLTEWIFAGWERNAVLVERMAADEDLERPIVRTVLAMRIALSDHTELTSALATALHGVAGTDEAWTLPEVHERWTQALRRVRSPRLYERDWQHRLVEDLEFDFEDPLALARRFGHQTEGQEMLARRKELVSACGEMLPERPALRRARQIVNRGAALVADMEQMADTMDNLVSGFWARQMTKFGDWEPPEPLEEDEFIF